MAAFIIGAEVAFWVFIALGLVVRYLFKMRKTSVFVLLLVPLIDVVLLAVAVIHMRDGATADLTHSLAALYLGFSVVFGHSMIRWADQRVAHRWAGGPKPKKAPRYGTARAWHEWTVTLKILIAWGLSVGIAFLMQLLVGVPERTDPLLGVVVGASKIVGISAIIALTYTIWPKEPKNSEQKADAQAERRERESHRSSVERISPGL
ncbi:hypothetical protein AB0I28_35640 [Phytomonospora sp. NPDC050363]|uniref:hypothetical protein n=1 Tax=Phytomonospora sp. NPDC050363 TaxID=3155642 RepID=UPI0033DCDFDE